MPYSNLYKTKILVIVSAMIITAAGRTDSWKLWPRWSFRRSHFELSRIRGTPNDVFAWLLLYSEIGNASLQTNTFQTLSVSIGQTSVTTVPNVYKKVVEVLKEQLKICASVAHFQLRTNPTKRFKHPMETPHFAMPKIGARQCILRHGPQQAFWNNDSSAILKLFDLFVQFFLISLPRRWIVQL